MKFRKGDTVKVIKGKDKGKTDKIEKILGQDKVLIANVNQYKRHLKARSQKQPSEIVTITKPISIANVAFICSQCHLTARIGFKIENDNKLRICKKCGKTV